MPCLDGGLRSQSPLLVLDYDHYQELFFLTHRCILSTVPGRQWALHGWYSVEFLIDIGCAASGERVQGLRIWGSRVFNSKRSSLHLLHQVKICLQTQKKKHIQSEIVVKGILVWHCTRQSLKENDLFQKMTGALMIIEKAYSKLYWCGFASHSFRCLPWASLFLLQASMLLRFPSCGLALTGDFYVTATQFRFTYMIFIFPESSRTSLYEYRVSSNPLPANGWSTFIVGDGVQVLKWCLL